MANLKEQNVWAAGIYQIETSDPVIGGPDGVDNLPLRQLTNRTLWLKNQIAATVQSIGVNKQWTSVELAKKADKTVNMVAGAGLTGGGTLAVSRTFALAKPSTLSGSTSNWAGNGETGHTHELAAASPTLAGVLKVLNVLSSSDGLAALSAQQGKVLAEMINKVAAGAFNFCGELGVRNLDDIPGSNAANYGLWYQTSNSNATKERGYPSSKAGVMLMVPAAYLGMQIYIPFDENIIFKRTTGRASGNYVYQPWQELGSDKLGNTGGQTLSGSLRIENSNWGKMYFPVAGGEWQIEVHPSGGTAVDTKRMNFVFAPSDGSVKTYLSFPNVGANEVVAYQRWVSAGLNGKVSNQGDEDVAGVKTFKNRQKFENRIQFSASAAEWGNGYSGEIGADSWATWIKNEYSGIFLVLKNNGELHYSGQRVALWNDRSDATNLDDTNKWATSRAVKRTYDFAGTKSTVSVITGTIAHGGTLPLPSGYTAGQCKWMVSMAEDNTAASYWDINENGAHGHYRIECSVNSSRVVTARAVKNWQLSSPIITNGTANYIVIGVK